jgi:hypothetical protein
MTHEEQLKIALEWIHDNPHAALCEVIKVHDRYTFGCKCVIQEIAPLVKKQYKAQFPEEH